MTADADRHLLFGLLTLQNGLINQDQLVAAFQAWTLDKSRSLGDHLEARGDLTRAKRSLLDTLAEVNLEAHGGDVGKSLATVAAGRSTRESLAQIGDRDIEATLGHVPSAHVSADDGNGDGTLTYAVGTATSDGRRFRLLRPHARGGLGAVFVALDAELNREVALKQILEHHADDPISRQRFLMEAEITGGLEHPGIVPVYGLGTYADGRPYYAMRFIKGGNLKEAIERFHGDAGLKADPGRRSLELRKLLRRFTDVCNAIEYAHSRGVLHRDIKPDNVIVGKHGETLVVDWGLAKPVGWTEPGRESAERTLVPSSLSGSAETLRGSALGTPAYMSPEQACGDIDGLGPRSDVYSLGATLYCLLTGRMPFEGQYLKEMLSKVKRGDFPPPRQLDSSLDRALEAICLKAMAFRPDDRYATSRALADDLERWAADEPVTAWAEPWTRKLSRWLTRHRTAVTGAAAAVLVGVVGLTAVLGVQARANGRLTQANIDLGTANAHAVQANTDLMSANQREKQRFELAMEAIKLFHGEVGDDLVLKIDQFKPLRDKLLRGAADFYGKLEGLLKDQPDRTSRGELGNAYFELGELTEKTSDQTAALAVHRKALTVRRALASEPNADEEANLDVPRSLKAIGWLQKKTGDIPGARVSLEEAVHLAQQAATRKGESAQAQAVEGMAYHYFASVLDDTGDDAGALVAYKKALAIRQKLADAYPNLTQVQRELANTHNNIGLVQNDLGERLEALDSYRRAVAIQQKQVDANPGVILFQQDLARTLFNIGQLQSLIGRAGEALESARRALAIEQRLADANPSVTSFQQMLALSHHLISEKLPEMGDPEGALVALDKAMAIEQKLVDANPNVTDYQKDLARTLSNMAVFLRKEHSPVESRDGYDRAVAILDRLVKDNPKNPLYQNFLAYGLRGRGLARLDLGDLAGVAADTRRSLEIWEKMTRRSGWEWFQVACGHATLSVLAGRDGSGIPAQEASAEVGQAMALLQKAVGLGFRELSEFRTETALDPLHDREEFRALLMDIAFPAKPFAP